MNTLCFWSGGKDSTASIILAHIHHLPITEIVFCEVMFDKSRNISGEIPEHIDFIRNIAMNTFLYIRITTACYRSANCLLK